MRDDRQLCTAYEWQFGRCTYLSLPLLKGCFYDLVKVIVWYIGEKVFDSIPCFSVDGDLVLVVLGASVFILTLRSKRIPILLFLQSSICGECNTVMSAYFVNYQGGEMEADSMDLLRQIMCFLVTRSLDVSLVSGSNTKQNDRQSYRNSIDFVVALPSKLFQGICELGMACRYESVTWWWPSSKRELHEQC